MKNKDLITEEAKKIVSGNYGKALQELSFQFILPIFWKKPKTVDANKKITNGTMFFIDTGEKCLAITANHVYEAYREAKAEDKEIISQLGNYSFELIDRLIDHNTNVDIATFRINKDEINRCGRICFTGSQKVWPPMPPQEGQTVFFGGYPKIERNIGENVDINFGLAFILCLASNTSSKQMTCQLEQSFLISIDHSQQYPNDYFWAGASGAPVISVIKNTIETFQLAGVISTSWDSNTIIISHAKHINADGTITE